MSRVVPVRRSWKVLAGIATGVLGLLAPWLVGLGDSRWWQLVPWALLAALWAGIVVHARRRRRDALAGTHGDIDTHVAR